MKKPKSLKQLARGAFITLSFITTGHLLTFLFTLIAARQLGPESYGLFDMSVIILNVAALVAGLGISRGVMKYVPHYSAKKDEKSLKGYIRFSFIFPLIASILTSILLYALSPNITRFFNFPSEFITFIRIISITIPFTVITEVLRTLLFAKKHVAYAAASKRLVEKISLLVGAILLIIYDMNAKFLVLWLFVTAVITTIYNLIVCKYKINLTLKKKEQVTKEWVFYSLPLMFTGFLAYLVKWTDNFVIAKYLTPADLGVYSVAFGLAAFLLIFKMSFTPIFFPMISEMHAKNKRKDIAVLYRKSGVWIFGLTLPFFVFTIFFSKQLLKFFYSEAYTAGYMAMIFVSLGFLINITTGMCGNILLTHKKTLYILKINIFVFVFNLILNIILVPKYGINGAGIASGISISIHHLLFLNKARKLERLIFDVSSRMKFVLSSLVSIFIIFSISMVKDNVFLGGISFLILYVFFLIILKALTLEELKELILNKKFQ